jgi:hypothetical protein
MSRASERDARDRAIEILKNRASSTRDSPASDGGSGNEYGAGPMTRAQKKSQDKHIPWTEGPKTTGQKIKRALW